MKKMNLISMMFALLAISGCNEKNSNQDSSVFNSSTSSLSLSETTSSKQDDKVIDMVVLAGQSNMEGHSWTSKLYENTPTTNHDNYRNGFSNSKIAYYCNNGSNKSEIFVPVRAGQGYGAGSFGPEVGIAEKYESYNRERPLYIVKYALGGTNLYRDWNTKVSNSLYYELISFVTDQIVYFEERDYDVNIHGLFWMQGEADSCEDVMTSQYMTNLSNLVESFREEFELFYGVDDKGIAFVDAGISDCSAWTNYQQINQIKEDFANSDPTKNFYFDTMDAGLEYDKDNTDIYHFDATSELELGKLFLSTLVENDWL